MCGLNRSNAQMFLVTREMKQPKMKKKKCEIMHI